VVVGQTGFVIDHIRRLRVLTVTEFFERRYSRGVRVLAASLLLIAGLLNMGVFLKLGAVFLVHATIIPPSYLNLTMTVLVIVVLVYTVLGGMVSVVITDYIQFLVLSIALLLVFGVWYELKDAAFRYLVQTTTIYYAGALAVLVGGLYWKRATAAGAYLGFTLGAALPLTQFGIGWAGTLVEFFPSIGKRGLYSFALGFVGIGIGSMLPFSKPKPYTIRTNSRPSKPLWNELANCLGDRPLCRHWSVHSGVSGRCHQGLWKYSQSDE